VAWLCDVCDKPIHLKRVNNKNYPIRCPLEKFRNVKNFYTQEFRQKLTSKFFDEFLLSNSPEDLEQFSEYIPDETPLSKYVKRVEDKKTKNCFVYTKTLIIEATDYTFFTHFTRLLMEVYDDNKILFVDSPRISQKNQYNYLWLFFYSKT